jgi:hypothetical protein
MLRFQIRARMWIGQRLRRSASGICLWRDRVSSRGFWLDVTEGTTVLQLYTVVSVKTVVENTLCCFDKKAMQVSWLVGVCHVSCQHQLLCCLSDQGLMAVGPRDWVPFSPFYCSTLLFPFSPTPRIPRSALVQLVQWWWSISTSATCTSRRQLLEVPTGTRSLDAGI